MNVTVNSQILAAELRLLNKVVPSNPAIAILSHMLMTATGDALGGSAIGLYATDLEVGVTTSCAGSVDEPGSAALPVERLLQMVEQFPDADVSIETNGMKAIVRCGAFTSRLQALPVEDFPTPPEVVGASSTVDAAALRGLIDKTRHAISATGTKYALKGALLTCVGSVAAMAATDGKRLALATMNRTGADVTMIVPVKTMDVLAGSADKGDLELTVGDRHLFFAAGERLLTSRKIDGAFPAYQKIVPRGNEHEVAMDRSQLTAALKRVALAAEENGAVYFDLTTNALDLSARSAGLGSADEALAVGYAGPPMKVCIQGSYVLDFLKASQGATVTMKLKDANTAVLLQDGNDHVGVIMPMRIK